MDAASSGGKRDQMRPDLDSLGSELLKQLVLAQQAEIDNLNLLVLKLKRMHFGQRSEKMNAGIEQLELWLEDLEANQAAASAVMKPAAKKPARVVSIVFGSQATIYAMRERQRFVGLRPSTWLIVSTVADIAIISILAVSGLAMAPLPLSIVAPEFGAAILFGVILNATKIPIFQRLRIS